MSGTPTPPALPLRDGTLPTAELIDLYMGHYAGRDPALAARLRWWVGRVGPMPFESVTDDHVHAALEDLARMPARYFAGIDADGRRIFKPKPGGKPMSAASVNRHHQALASVFTWAIKRRIAPKGWLNPCRSVDKRSEAGSARARYLTDAERDRLLAACKGTTWPKLYLLVLLALSTGARKNKLMGLRWADVDLPARLAHVARSKNGDAKALPLVPAAVDELLRFRGAADVLVFGSTKAPGSPFNFTPAWSAALKAAHIRGFRFHDLRHSCASFLAKNGATLLEIADLLGHRQISMTRRYSHLAASHRSALVDRVMGELR